MKFLTLILAMMVFNTSAQAQETYDPTGYWLTENERSVIEVENCDTGLCGYIHWIVDGGMQYDTKNPQENLRGQAMCGLKIMQGLKPTNNPNRYDDGQIYKADDGDIFDANLTMKAQDKLTVRGYMGISLLGKSQDWKRVSANDYSACRKP